MGASFEEISAIGAVLISQSRPLKERFRALFTLKNIGGQTAIDCIVKGFSDPSALLKHELAYCLGQMRDIYAIPHLVAVLKDSSQEPMVRHEAGEALGAIGDAGVMNLLNEYSKDSVPEVAETCQIALGRIKWMQQQQFEEFSDTSSKFTSIDPAPAEKDVTDVTILKERLLNAKLPLFDRYKAMFALRNLATTAAVDALGEGLQCEDSALFRHEVAFIFGQMQDKNAVPYLIRNLEQRDENEMVRHECAEALGSIATDQCTQVLQLFLNDEKEVVRESCEVALDISEYENSCSFQYADGLQKLQDV